MEVLKEYLVPGLNKLTLIKNPPLVLNYYIEVPEGAGVYGKPPGSDCPYFHKALDGQNWYYSSIIHQWSTSGHPVGKFDEILWERETATHPDPLPFVDDYNPFGYGDGKHDTDGNYKIDEPKVEKVRFNSDVFSHKHSSDEPPAYYGNAIRQKPRQRVYAVMGADDCVRVPKLTAEYLFNTVQTLGFVSAEQKCAVLYHLNYLKANQT